MAEKAENTNKKKNILHMAGDLIWAILGLVLMNGMVQLLINPKLEQWMGEESFGDYQSVFSIVAIMGTTFGVAANFSRMVKSRVKKDRNGDYNIFLAISSAICVGAAAVALVIYDSFNAKDYILLIFLMIFTVLRYYGDVYFRLHLNYKGYFVYYAVITAGYCIGLLVFRYLFEDWIITFLIGEALAFVFVFFRGDIFRGKNLFKPSPYFKENSASMWILTGTDIITAVTQNADRIILNLTAGGAAVTTFYVSTLLGKVVSLLTTPLNGVMIGYLEKYDGKITKKIFSVFVFALLGLAILATLACYVASIIFVKIFYPNVFESAKEYFFFANAGQVFFFISNCLMTVLLRMANEKYQMGVNIAYAVVYAAAVVPLTIKYQIWGLVWGLMIANIFKFVLVSVIGYTKTDKDDGEKNIPAAEKAE